MTKTGTHPTITFAGGAGEVTGANFLLTVPAATGAFRVLVDCGLAQGCRFCEAKNRDPFPYDPATIDVLVVTHAHLDHIGRIPKLVRDGFSGVIYSTTGTRELAEASLEDSIGVLAEEAREDGVLPLYEEKDVRAALALWKDVPYGATAALKNGVSFMLRDAGHILGSSIVEFSYREKRIVFTGDLGNSPSPLLNDTEAVTDATYLVMESVYGDRNHESIGTRTAMLEDIVTESVRRGGALIIPTFSIERTQILLYELNRLVEEKKIPSVPVFLDSPLAIRVTAIYKRHLENMNPGVRAEIRAGDDIFDFPRLTLARTGEDSRAIDRVPGPKIIIAGSGMSMGGRVTRHERMYLPDPESTFLTVGYQAVGTLGRQIADGAKEVTIFNERVPVRAAVRAIRGYSAHKDSDGLVDFVSRTAGTVKRVFVAMGEPKASLFLAQRLREYLGVNAVVPTAGEIVELDL